ncbi:MAG: amidohydrolase family protein [Actinomycetota bacterium]|nr:amidohydrolase family protein [Actinomycetota bacterium]
MGWSAVRSRREILASFVAVGLAVWQNARGSTHAAVKAIPPTPTAAPLPSPTPAVSVTSEPALGGFDVVIAGGRVIDPETKFDRVTNVGIKRGTIAAINDRPLAGSKVIDAKDLVVSPGFIDNLSYEPNAYGVWFKIADGVTTTLGMHGLDGAASSFLNGSTGKFPLHFGGAFDDPWWRASIGVGAYKSPSASQISQLVSIATRQLRDGWMGIDVEPEYDPGTTFAETLALAKLAAKHDMPVYSHVRYSDDVAPGTNLDAIRELIKVGRESGAAVHVDHINSTGGAYTMPESLDMIAQARAEGLDVTACIYPYNYWSTFLASARFDHGWQDRFHITYADLEMPGTGERLTAASFDRYRAENRVVIAHAIPEKDVVTALKSPFVMMGSDTILVKNEGRHPRGAGAFSRVLGKYVREEKILTLMDALAKMTILPAQRVERGAPAMKKKGRLQPKMDADITIFDPATVIDKATIRDPRQYSHGIEWVLVAGEIVKDPSGMHKDVLPGKPVFSTLALDGAAG